jgi:two-component system chemotaxis response regulator CheY
MLEQTSPLDSDHEGLPVADAGRSRLLVIDDDNLYRMIICRMAVKAGYAPAGAATYDEAAKLLAKTQFDCITLDLSLGDHGGVDMMHHLRDIGCKAPIIIVSGCDGATCRESAGVAKLLSLNVLETIPKPVDLVVLRFWLDRLKGQHESAAVAA